MAVRKLRHPALLAWLHLIRVHNKIEHRSLVLQRRYDLTPARFDVLAHLMAAPGITQQALAERLLVTKGNVCGILDRMVEGGLVERRLDPEDRRANRLYLTSQGQALADEVVPAQEALIKEALSGLDPDQQRLLHQLLRRLDQQLDVD